MPKQNLKDITDQILGQAKQKGWGTKPNEINVAEKIALIHTEVSEAYENYRHKRIKDVNGFNEQLADIAIRLFHLAGIFGVDLEKEITKKLTSNTKRKWDWTRINEKHT